MTISDHSDIRMPLASIRQRLECHLAGVSRYRALLAIDKSIADLAGHPDLAEPLLRVRDQILLQLSEMREYRALGTIDKVGPELIDILAFLDAEPHGDEAPLRPDNPVEDGPAEETDTKAHIVDVYSRADAIEQTPATQTPETRDVGGTESRIRSDDQDDGSPHQADTSRAVQSNGLPEVNTADEPVFRDMSEAFHASRLPVPDLADRTSQDADDASDESASPPVATLAYNLANMLVQSLPPGQGDAAVTSESGDDTESNNEAGTGQAIREGRAA